MALALVTLPLLTVLFSWVTLFTAPVALFLVVCYWNEPRQHPFERTRVRLVLAALLSVASLIGWSSLFYIRLSELF